MAESDGLLNRCTFNKYPGFESRSLRAFFTRGAVLCALAAIALLPTPSAWAQEGGSSLSEQYLSLRRAYPPLKGLTPIVLRANPGAYRGKTLELTGRLTGVVRDTAAGGSNNGGTNGASLMLQTREFGGLTLSVSFASEELQAGREVRILAVVTSGDGDGSHTVIVGMPDMEAVAVASASDIAALEVQWARFATVRAARERQNAQALEAAARSLRVAGTGGNKGSARMAPPPAPPSGLSANAQQVYGAYYNYIVKCNRRLTVGQADAITRSILLFSERYDVDPRLVVALIIAESDFRPGETSNKGAMGLGQIMPDEAHDLRLTNPYDPVQNIAGAVYLLRGRLDKYSGNAAYRDVSMQHIILALASYNAGMGAVKKYGGVPPYRETQNYVKKITRIYKELCQGDPANASTRPGGIGS